MSVQVKTYYARWKPEEHTGYVVIYWDGGAKSFPEGSFQSPDQFRVVVDLLRNESPIWWDDHAVPVRLRGAAMLFVSYLNLSMKY